MSTAYYSTLTIFLLTYLALAFDNLPILKIDRPMIAFIGAIAIFVFTPYTFLAAAFDINLPLLFLLLAMMIIVAYLEISGFFKVTILWIEKHCQTANGFLALTIFLSGVLSAFLINDIVCLALSPLLIRLCHNNRLPTLPYLLALGTAANIGSVATLTGNPQNMLIGNFCHISYLQFSLHTAPIAASCLIVNYFIIAYFFRKELSAAQIKKTRRVNPYHIEHKFLFYKSIVVTCGVIILFFTHIPLTITALGAAAILLIDNTSPSLIYPLLNWPLLILFIGLFILIGAVEHYVLPHWQIGSWPILKEYPKTMISIASVVLSNIVSNVPAVLLFKPLVLHAPQPKTLGILLAVTSTLAGNFTILGSLANLIVVTMAKKHGESIGFWQFLRFGAPITFATLFVAAFFFIL